MKRQERLLRKIANKEKIILSFGCDSLKAFALILSIIYLIITLSILYFFHLNFKTLILLSFPLLAYIISLNQLKKYVSASVRGEMLMSESIFKKNKITSLKSIKEMSSIQFFNYEITKITYKLDGNTLKVKFINKNDSEHLRPIEIINTLLKEVN
jgi:hypothetical protein